ncbi:hypothetical protein D3C83_31200 [compost metagenome]
MRLPGDLLVHCAKKRRQRFQDRDLGAQAPPHAAHLQADDSGADHAQALGNLRYRQRAVVIEYQLVVERRAR